MSGTVTTGRCRICRHDFDFVVTQDDAKTPHPDVCGHMLCQAKGYWTAPQWAHQLRMAEARDVAGVALGPLDIEARRRLARDGAA